jgi:tripeptide aminopeptidase
MSDGSMRDSWTRGELMIGEEAEQIEYMAKAGADSLMINEKRLVDQFCELVLIDSPSLGERQMADTIKILLGELGCQVREDETGPRISGNCGNLVATCPGSLEGPPLLLAGHLDTVEPCHGKKAVIGGDRIIRSQGTTILGADDLAGITAILEALRTARERNIPHRSLEFLLTVAEELHLKGSHQLEPGLLQAREAYVLDTSGAPGFAVLAAPGHILMSFAVTGKAAHAGIAPQDGINAITAAARGIAAMKLGRIDPDTTANIGRIEGGGETNIVAAHCLVTAECRSLDYGRLVEQAAGMRGAMEQAAFEAGASLAVEQTISYLPYHVDAVRPVVRRFENACRLSGLTARLGPGGGGSDNNVLAQMGIEGIVLSCGMNQVHSCREEISIADLCGTARLLLALISLP